MKQHLYTIKIHPADPDEGGYWVEVPALPGCFTEGETYEEAVENAQEAIQCHLKSLMQNGEAIPTEDQPEAEITAAVSVQAPETV